MQSDFPVKDAEGIKDEQNQHFQVPIQDRSCMYNITLWCVLVMFKPPEVS